MVEFARLVKYSPTRRRIYLPHLLDMVEEFMPDAGLLRGEEMCVVKFAA